MNIYEKYKNIAPDEFIDIPGYEGLYQINSLEQVKSLSKWVDSNNDSKFLTEDRILTNCFTGKYKIVILYKNKKRRTCQIHVLLAKAFIPNPNNYPIVRHLNDIKTDNRLENLSWGTYKDNSEDSKKNGTFFFMYSGEKNHMYGKKGELHPTYGKFRGANSHKSKLIFDTQTGIFYDSIREAANSKNMNESTLAYRLRGVIKNKTGLIYA